ncbi:MAG: 16S rRNA (uracil(1498)-N(3))-methyltransferase [Clostridiales bacterium]|nr:16S rRNA (uracil(1498)-N(3))-methyltransferase [Clostridiales bacterium]
MHRFFVDYKITSDQIVIDDKNDVNHIKRALRVTVGEKLEICDAESDEYIVEVKSIDDVIVCDVIEKNAVDRESPIQVDLYQGLAKGSKMETIIQKSVELGIHTIYPLNTKRAIVKLDDKGEKKKIERWQKIADEAAKQSKRSHLPVIENVISVKNFSSVYEQYDLILVAYELESSRTLKQLLSNEYKRIAVIIGPEGGFEVEEVELLVGLGAHSISLGPRILRTETAGSTLVSILQYELGDISK